MEGQRLKGLQCASIHVPLDYAHPHGPHVTLALTRARHTARRSQGVVLLNRGGPGAHGRDMPPLFTSMLPKRVAAAYDWIGFDPRGVGASKPALVCDKSYQYPGGSRSDTVPANETEERAWLDRARAYARDCGSKYRQILPYMNTVTWARDLDSIRAALEQKQITYFGYSYGTYLGAVYATMFPRRVRRMVLDSVVRPSGVWYRDNLDQNVAFEKRIQKYFAWIARHHRTYGLGRDGGKVAAAYTRARAALKAKPIDGQLGASELDELFLADGYGDFGWDRHARALSAYVVKHDPGPLRRTWRPPGLLDQNNYAVYLAVQCRDAAWPRDWWRWHADSTRLYQRGYRFETWGNTWFNAPCAFWSVPSGPRPVVRGTRTLPPVLLVQGADDAATPYSGAVEMHRLLPTSRLLVQKGGGNHGVSMWGDKCIDQAVAAYLGRGALPAARSGPDAVCAAGPAPEPVGGTTPQRAAQRP